MGQYEKAREYLEKSLKIYEEHYGKRNIQVAWALANLGRFYRHIGDQRKAKILLERCLDIHDSYPIKDEIENAWVTINLGVVFHNIGDLTKSKTLIDKGVKIYKRYYNTQDYELCWALIHKALIDADISGDWISAKAIISQNTNIFIDQWGNDHVVSAWAIEKLIRAYIQLKDYPQAYHLLLKVLTIYQKKFGDDSIQVAFCNNHLGSIHLVLGNYVIADSLFKSAFAVLYDKQHPRMYIVLENLVKSYQLQNSFYRRCWSFSNIYEPLLQETVKKYFPSDSPFLFKVYMSQAPLEGFSLRGF